MQGTLKKIPRLTFYSSNDYFFYGYPVHINSKKKKHFNEANMQSLTFENNHKGGIMRHSHRMIN